MKLVAGSYERYLWGWRVEKKKGQLHPIFSYPAHLAPIKCITSWGSVLATGGGDDTIRIFDTNANTDMGTLTHHTGAVTALAFHGSTSYPSNLLSASEDGMVCLWDTDSWLLYKSMKGHRNGVSDLSIHPSGRLCVSVGRDSHLNMYDLIKGRRCFTSKLSSEASLVRFSPMEGGTYALVSDDRVVIHCSDDGRPLHTLPHQKRVLCLAQEEDGLLFTGGEDRMIRAWDTRSAKLAMSVTNAHTNRVRGLCLWAASQTLESSSCKVASASSDGCVRVWDTRLIKKSADSTPIMEAETKARLTCLVACTLKRINAQQLNNNEINDAINTSLADDATEVTNYENHVNERTKRGALGNDEVSDKHIKRKKIKQEKDKRQRENGSL